MARGGERKHDEFGWDTKVYTHEDLGSSVEEGRGWIPSVVGGSQYRTEARRTRGGEEPALSVRDIHKVGP